MGTAVIMHTKCNLVPPSVLHAFESGQMSQADQAIVRTNRLNVLYAWVHMDNILELFLVTIVRANTRLPQTLETRRSKPTLLLAGMYFNQKRLAYDMGIVLRTG